MTRTILLAAMSLLVLTAASAEAAPVINTPPFFGSLLNNAVFGRCTAVNVSKKPVEVTMEIINATSGAVDSTTTATVDPDKRITVATANAGDVATFCRVTGLSKKAGTVSYVVTDAADNPLAIVSAP